jgi:hypothetical protein
MCEKVCVSQLAMMLLVILIKGSRMWGPRGSVFCVEFGGDFFRAVSCVFAGGF